MGEWIVTRNYAQEYIGTYGFVNNIEVPEVIFDIDWDQMEASLDEGISDTPQVDDEDVIDKYIELEIEGVGYNSKTKLNRVEMIEALVDWAQIEDETFDVHEFFRPTGAETPEEEF